MSKMLIGAAALALTMVSGAAAAQPWGYDGYRGYDRGHVRDSDRDGVPDRREWNRDRDRDGRPDQWDRYDNRQGRHFRDHRRWRDGRSYNSPRPRAYAYGDYGAPRYSYRYGY